MAIEPLSPAANERGRPGSVRRGKLLPPRIASDVITRPRLESALDRIWSVPLGLVVGPAGYGKSTLARRWGDLYPGRIAWMTIDERSSSPETFLPYVLTALQSIDPDVGENTKALIESPSRPSMLELGETLADELIDAEHELCLVIDEAEHLIDQDVWAFLEAIVRLAPGSFHLLIVSRVDPPLPVARLRMRKHLVEVRSSDLLFTSDETFTLLTAHAPGLSPEAAAAVQRLTHGWAAGVRLATLAIPEDTVLERIHVRGAIESSRSFILDALVEEVLQQLTPSLLHGLLTISILDEVSPPLAETMLGAEDALALADAFRRSGMFAPSTVRSGWWRLHPLFRDLLDRQLRERMSRRQIAELHRSAAARFSSEGEIRPAIRHLLAAGEIDAVVSLLDEEIPRVIEREEVKLLAEWISELPNEVIAGTPSLAVGRCWSIFFRGIWSTLRPAREQARALCQSAELDETRRAALLAELDIMEGSEVVTLGLDPARTLELLDEAEPHILSSRPFVRGHWTLYRAFALESLGRQNEADDFIKRSIERESGATSGALVRAVMARLFICWRRGDMSGVESSGTDLLLLSERGTFLLARGWARLFLGWVAFERNDLDSAEQLLSDVLEHGDDIHLAALREAMTLLARIYWIQDQRAEAAAVVRRVREILARRDAAEMLASVAIFESFLEFQDRPDHPQPRWLAESGDDPARVTPQLLHHPVTVASLVMCQSGDPAQVLRALALTERFETELHRQHFPVRIPETRALQAIALFAAGRHEEAVARLRAAMEYPFATDLKRTFCDLGPLFQELVDHARATNPCPEITQLAEKLEPQKLEQSTVARDDLSASSPGSPPLYTGKPLLQLLTDRELSVLECLDRRLSYKEIGDELYISPLTVKRHAGNIYGKLGAINRREAVYRARELGWRPRGEGDGSR